VARCSLCGKPAIVFIRYQRRYMCQDHFKEFIVNKVRRSIRRYKLIHGGGLILVPVSGGKDSATLLSILSTLSNEYGFKVLAMHINLGIGEYSRRSMEAAVEEAKLLSIPILILDVKELIGYTIPELAKLSRRPVCSVCGLVKRYLINAVAVEAGADYVALGHNADDLAVYSMKSFMLQDLEAIGKLGPKTESIPGVAVGRIRPLYEVYERESFLYAYVNGIPFIHDECPNVNHESLELQLKGKLNEIEEKRPGIKITMVRGLARRIKDFPRPEYRVVKCRYCGLLSSDGVCSFCKLTKKITGEPLGPRVREIIKKLLNMHELRR